MISWLTLLFAAEVGLASQSLGPYEFVDAVYTHFEVEAILADVAFVGGSTDIYSAYISPLAYAPFDARYHFTAGLRYGPLEVGWRHTCIHPVLSGPREPKYLYGGSDHIYLRLEASTK